MRPVIVDWLVRHGWPAWFAPDYAMMVGLSTLLATVLVLRRAERDGARVEVQARAIACAYLGALLGGYVFEWIRAIPEAVAEGTVAPIVYAGRAAYGGLVFGALAPVIYLRRRRQTFLDFLDRATLGMGLVFAFVRFGCFLEGCDYGTPTASWLGVRFPAGSLAADAHLRLGWVAAQAPSLPVHPTELYESCVGLLATGLALVPLRKGRRDGAAFGTWLMVYAIGRFAIEQLRGDVERGRYGSFSTAQWVSIAIVIGVFVVVVARRSRLARVATVVAAGALFVAYPRTSFADEPLPPLPPSGAPPAEPGAATEPSAPPAPAPTVASPPAAAASAAPSDKPAAASGAAPEDGETKRIVTLRLAIATSQTLARPDVPSGWAGEIDALYRLRLGGKTRLDLGLEGRRFENVEAIHASIGVVGELVIEAAKRFELTLTLVPHHTWFQFESPWFSNTNAYGLRYALGAQFPIGRVTLGVTPVAFTTTSATTVGVISQWEPRLWVGVSF